MTVENVINRYDSLSLIDSITKSTGTTAYTAGDAVSEVTTNDYFTFGNTDTQPVCRFKSHPTGIITGARITSSANQSTKLDGQLILFNTAFAETADNDPWAVTDAALLTRVGSINFPAANWYAGTPTAGAGGNAFCDVDNLGLVYTVGADKVLYGQLVARNAYTPVDSEVFTITLLVTLD